jgi:hypothetical protein
MAGIHNQKVIAGMVLCSMVLTGCGAAKVPDVVTETSLVIEKDGKVTSHLVDVFDKDYYDLHGLREMAQEEADAYNTAHGAEDAAPVTVERVESLPGDDSTVVVTYSYDSADTYEDYNGSSLFYGTAQQAEQAGYQLDETNQVLWDTKGEKSIVSTELGEGKLAQKHVILLEEQTRVYCPYQVAYISEDAVVQEDGSIDTTGICEYPVIIVLDK